MLRIMGSIENVLFSRVDDSSLAQQILDEPTFAIGCGGIADSVSEAKPILGELAVLPGLAAVLPGDGQYFAGTTSLTCQTWWTPFQLTVAGLNIARIGKFGIEANELVSARDIWKRAIATLPTEEQQAPLFSMIWSGKISSLRGSFLKKPPLLSLAPENGKPIGDVSNYADWFGIDPDGGSEGINVLVTGAAYNPESPDLVKLYGLDKRIFYRHPSAPAQADPLMIHQHAVLFKNKVKFSWEGALLDAVLSCFSDAEIIDVKHVLDDSTFSFYGGVVKAEWEIEPID